jgi:hypothetical protein
LGDAAGTVFWSGAPQVALGDGLGGATGDALMDDQLSLLPFM